MSEIEPPIYLTAEDVAGLLQPSKSTVYRMAKRDRTMPCLTLGGIVRFPRERLLAWFRQRERGSVPRPRALRTVGSVDDGHTDGHSSATDEAARARGAR